MKVFRFWADHTEPGDDFPVKCWAASNQSLDDALRQAADRARGVVSRLRAGDRSMASYEYGHVGLREEIVQELRDDTGSLIGAITRNRYGALVLNSARTFFADVDLPAPSALDRAAGFLGRLLSKRPPPPEPQQQLVQRIRAAVDRTRGLGMRLYRTCAGFRVIVTTAEHDPASDESLALMNDLGSDSLYVRLCRSQQCFRARLTPKPWRCGADRPPLQYPFPDSDSEAAYRRWEKGYDDQVLPYATCAFIGTFGTDAVIPAVAPIVDIHDTWTVGEGRLA